MKPEIRISRNFILGTKISNANVIVNTAHARRSVYHRLWKRTVPAAWIMSMQFKEAMHMVNGGYLYQVKSSPIPQKKCPWPIYVYNDNTGMFDIKRK